jgi:NarL family two-component system response regulator YdfI
VSARRRSGGKEVTTVFIVAASDVVRAGLESLMAKDAHFTIERSVSDLSELAAQATEGASPDVVVFDLEGQQEESLASLRFFIEEMSEGNDLPFFVVIGNGQSRLIRDALRAGVVRAVIPRAASSDELIAAVEAVSAGLVALDTETFNALLSTVDDTVDGPPGTRPVEEHLTASGPEIDALTPREREVLEMLAEGLSNKEIAWRMKISEHTVKFHVASIFDKLDVSTRTEAVMQGIRKGLVMM